MKRGTHPPMPGAKGWDGVGYNQLGCVGCGLFPLGLAQTPEWPPVGGVRRGWFHCQERAC